MKQFHEVANIFPMMDAEQFKSLVEDVKQNGLLVPIWLHPDDGSIIDGRNRYKACLEAGITPQFKTWNGRGSLVSFVVSLNLARRHLTSSQRACLAVDTEAMLAEEARARSLANLTNSPLEREKIPAREERPRDEAAAIFNTNGRYVQDAKKLKTEAPDLFQAVASGDMPITRAVKAHNKAKAETLKAKPIPPPKGKYNTIVIDPPWPVDDIARDVRPQQYAFDYPTMTIEEIKNFSIPNDIAMGDCHLFLWITQKLLPIGFEILKEWDFRYIFAMTWHKNGGFQPFNLPQYNSEFVLYARRGAPKFTSTKAFNTCFSANRAGHSVKPTEFYELLKRVTPSPRIEVFSRAERDGFDIWGNEV